MSSQTDVFAENNTTPEPKHPTVILASASPRRRELLALLGVPFQVVSSCYDEPISPDKKVDMAQFVTLLAHNKAAEVAERLENLEDCLVIGADTEVALNEDEEGDLGIPLGKPQNSEDACRMLRLLAGNTHSVYTGIAVLCIKEDAIVQSAKKAVRTRVRFREMSDVQIKDYVATGEPLDKAGAYGAQGYASPFIESYEGDFFNVVGLPVCALSQLLEEMGIFWWEYRMVKNETACE